MRNARVPFIYVTSLLAMFFFACEDSTSASGSQDEQSRVDTVYVRDTVNIKGDTIRVKGDTVVVTKQDTVIKNGDTVVVSKKDTLVVKGDTVVVTKKDTLVLDGDTVVVRDTLYLRDTVYARDTILDTLYLAEEKILQECANHKFDEKSQFCYMGNVYPLCGGKTYNPDSATCVNDVAVLACGGTVYDKAKKICYKNKLHDRYVRMGKFNYEYFVDDRDGQFYRSIPIGNQTWMAQNLNYAVDSSWCAGGIATSPDDFTQGDCEKYGRVYRWASAMNIPDEYNEISAVGTVVDTTKEYQGACPNGWHVPNHHEWYALEDYIYTNIDPDSSHSISEHLKSDSLWVDGYGWMGSGDDRVKVEIPKGINSVGLNILPVGSFIYYDSKVYPSYFGQDSRLWSVNETYNTGVYVVFFSYSTDYKTLKYYKGSAAFKNWAWSLRCLKNNN
ncbi:MULTISPECIES: FISUMP domain-containing protein [unclassified Fibrobacter]|uniref:FISUMP domain-containing protein n=1 Tax=unclassified Fibrobacter TaxID=2634177 RepID=UPI00091284C3|nr:MULTISPECIES: FISUMP domain-containing protein [unclassified Fibrobacter]OWV05501.1 hypothetical protein B7993_07810 [Fibrobacter sp. UWH3]SHK43147.1 major paralogous domain-containing protein [Fibrobacter sp. UWH6]